MRGFFCMDIINSKFNTVERYIYCSGFSKIMALNVQSVFHYKINYLDQTEIGGQSEFEKLGDIYWKVLKITMFIIF
jgi:hypothetical protein